MKTLSISKILFSLVGWLFGFLVMGIAFVNCFWGNDTGFGIFLGLSSFIFLPPVNEKFHQITGFQIPATLKLLAGIFIIWAAVGVGELFIKIDMMLMDF